MAATTTTATNASPAPSAPVEASAASAPSTTPASPQNSESNSGSTTADSFVKAPDPTAGSGGEGSAAAQTAAAATRPDWLPETLWDAEKGAKADDIKAIIADGEKARARAAEIPASADAYKPELPKIEGLPEGVTVDVADPRFKAAAAVAHEAGLSQKEFSALLGVEAQRVMAVQKQVGEAIKARDAALGPNGTARVDAVNTFFKSIAPDERVAFELGKTLFTPGVIETWERVQRALGSQGVSTLARAPSGGGPAGKIEGYDKMTMAQRLQATGNL